MPVASATQSFVNISHLGTCLNLLRRIPIRRSVLSRKEKWISAVVANSDNLWLTSHLRQSAAGFETRS